MFESIEQNYQLRRFLIQGGFDVREDFYFDGHYIISSIFRADLPDDLSGFEKAFEYELIIVRRPGIGFFRFEFAQTENRSLLLEFDEREGVAGTVMLQGILGREVLLKFPVPSEMNRVAFKIVVSGKSLSISSTDATYRIELDEPLIAASCKLSNHSTCFTTVESLCFNGNSLLSPLPESTLDSRPAAPVIHLPLLLRFHDGSHAYILFGFLVLALLAFLLESVISLSIHSVQPGTETEQGMEYVFLPVLAVALSCTRSMLGLSLSALIFVLFWITVTNTLSLFSHGKRRSKPGPISKWAWIGFFLELVLFGFAAAPALNVLVHTFRYEVFVAVCAILPPVLFYIVIFLSIRIPVYGRVWPVLLQATTYLWFSKYYYFLSYPVFFLLAFSPWMIWHSVRFIKNYQMRFRWHWVIMIPLACALTIICCETAFRTSRYLDNLFRLDNRFGLRNTDRMWDLESYTNTFGNIDSSDEFKVNHRYHPVAKPENVFRVVCLGSSSTWGAGATSPSTAYPGQLEKCLQDRSFLEIEVINGGIPGAACYMLQVFLGEVLLSFNPDIVIFYFGWNEDLFGLREYYAELRDIAAEPPEIKSNAEVWQRLRFSSRNPLILRTLSGLCSFRSFNALVTAMERVQSRSRLNPGGAEADFSSGVIPDCPYEIVDLCVESGIPVLLVPEIAQEYILGLEKPHGYFKIFNEIAMARGTEGVYNLDLLETFCQYYNSLSRQMAEQTFSGGMHMIDRGYAFLADRIADYLFVEGHVPAGSTPVE